jgi:hypothetical protein
MLIKTSGTMIAFIFVKLTYMKIIAENITNQYKV